MGRNGSYVVLRQSAQDVRSFSRSTAVQSDAAATGGNGRSPSLWRALRVSSRYGRRLVLSSRIAGPALRRAGMTVALAESGLALWRSADNCA